MSFCIVIDWKERALSTKDIIVVGPSAGGVEALQRLCAGLPGDIPAAIFIAQHFIALYPQRPATASRQGGPLRAISPVDGQEIEPGHVYVAAPDYHMLRNRPLP